ncbi:MAG: glycosyltransferase [Desulfovibrio sp.]|uniref:glycosyltransferase n=1 Tax=Desulfovibrio sp. TaxID=885 RepID=UPI001A76A1D3|nr:glycosyltransferase [Desulfovibrio sp.]MBD5417272.1 glycosyltransferase [Desulfovibrio sp.]
MGRLLLYTDLGPSRAWLFAALLANRERLAARGMVFAPFDNAYNDLIPSHRHLWPYFPQDTFSALQEQHFTTIAEELGKNKDVLCLIPTFSETAHAKAWEALKERVDFSQHEVKALTIVGRPSLLLEYHWREWKGSYFAGLEEYYKDMVSLCGQLPDLLTGMESRFGAAGHRLVADTSAPTEAVANLPLLDVVADFLGHAPLEAPLGTPYSSLFLHSHAARRLAWVPSVAYNAWPPIDDAKLMASLQALDAGRANDVMTPEDVKAMYLEQCGPATTRLETMLALPQGSLGIPPWFSETSVADRFATPDAASIRAFARELEPETRRALLARLHNDEVLLNEDQRALYTVLSEDAPAEFRQVGEPEEPALLTVLTMAYNQEKYIAQCMDSVLEQKTEFPVQHIVLDHCSEDATPAIIAEYAAKHPSIRPVLLAKHIPYENTWGLLSRCRTKYAALCDGDDYFTEPTKLQKQVDFLEENPDCALCFHPVLAVFEDKKYPPFVHPPQHMLPRGLRKKYYLADMLNGNLIQTNSVVYRWRFREGLPDWFRPDLCPGDWYWHLLHAETGKIGFIPEIMSVYRRHSASYYADSFISHVNLRRQHGMEELETYAAMNAHFKNRYFRAFSTLANGVFADFLEIQARDGTSNLLDEASKKYPEFTLNFLKNLKKLKAESRSPQPGGPTGTEAPFGGIGKTPL